MAGNFFVMKAVGAAAEQGKSLEQLEGIGNHVVSVVRTMGMALTGCTPPAKGTPIFTLADDEMEMGIGIHGEPGRKRVKLASANAIVDELFEAVSTDLPYKAGDEVALMINGMGGTPISELYILYAHAHEQCEKSAPRLAQLRGRILHLARDGGLLAHPGQGRRSSEGPVHGPAEVAARGF